MQDLTRRAIATIHQTVYEDGSVDLTFHDVDPLTGIADNIHHDHYDDPSAATAFITEAAERFTAPKLRAFQTQQMPAANHWRDEDGANETLNDIPDVPSVDDVARLACGCKLLRSKAALLSACRKHST